MQVHQIHAHIQSFGGLNFLNESLNDRDFDLLVGKHLGRRSTFARYGYNDLLLQLFYTACIGGSTLDESQVLKDQMKDHPSLKIASADTIEYAFQELRIPNREVTTARGTRHKVNEHKGFNSLLAAVCAPQLKQRGNASGFMMDYDGHIIENRKKDNAFTYKKSQGYYPVICSINKLPVYMQNRNGNTPESWDQTNTIQAAIHNCRLEGVDIKAFRADACCYQQDTVEYLESQRITYYIRAEHSQRLVDALVDEVQWETVMLGHRKVEVCSFEEEVLGKPRRIIAYRYQQNGQLEIFDKNGYRYYAIVTSDIETSPLDCIKTYNQRGCDGEHHFKELDHDFNFNKMPFDNMEMNTIYLYAMLVSYSLFQKVKNGYSEKLVFVKREMRLKRFILHFVTLPAKWVKTARRWVLKIFTTKDYRPLYAP